MTAFVNNEKAAAQFATFISKDVFEYQVTAVTFDGEEITLHVEAANRSEAEEIALNYLPNIDYVMM